MAREVEADERPESCNAPSCNASRRNLLRASAMLFATGALPVVPTRLRTTICWPGERNLSTAKPSNSRASAATKKDGSSGSTR